MDAGRPGTADFDGGAKKESSIASFEGFTSHSTRMVASTGACSMSMGLRSELTSQPPRARNARRKRPYEPEDFALGRSRGGFGTKLYLVADGGGIPLGAVVTAGHRHESVFFEEVMDTVRISRRRRLDAVVGNKGYSYPRIRTRLRRRGIEPVIPTRSNQAPELLDKAAYRGRNHVERCIGWLKHCRRLATRYEKLASSYLAFVKVAMIQRCLRLLDPSNRT